MHIDIPLQDGDSPIHLTTIKGNTLKQLLSTPGRDVNMKNKVSSCFLNGLYIYMYLYSYSTCICTVTCTCNCVHACTCRYMYKQIGIGYKTHHVIIVAV